jgi:hypothetical protein
MLDYVSRMTEQKATRPLLVYTAILGRPDQLPAIRPALDADFLCLTDQPIRTVWPWRVLRLDHPADHPRTAARFLKLTGHNHLAPHYPRGTLWIDGGLDLVHDPIPWTERRHVVAHSHFHRCCAYDEICELTTMGLLPFRDAQRCAAHLLAEGWPVRRGLHDTSLLFRASAVPVADFNRDWQCLLDVSRQRDQVWFDFLVARHGLKLGVFPGKTREPLADRHYGQAVARSGHRAEPFRPWLSDR